MEDKSIEVKVVLLGDSGVGKSSIVHRFIYDQFDISREGTVGASFQQKCVNCQNKVVKFQIWDTAGQEKYHSLAPIYYKDSNIALVVYDITSEKSFQVVQDWIQELSEYASEDIIIALIGNKMDLDSQQTVPYEDAFSYSKSVKAIFKLTSAKDNKGIHDLFESLADEVVRKDFQDKQKMQISKYDSKKKNKKKCC